MSLSNYIGGGCLSDNDQSLLARFSVANHPYNIDSGGEWRKVDDLLAAIYLPFVQDAALNVAQLDGLDGGGSGDGDPFGGGVGKERQQWGVVGGDINGDDGGVVGQCVVGLYSDDGVLRGEEVVGHRVMDR